MRRILISVPLLFCACDSGATPESLVRTLSSDGRATEEALRAQTCSGTVLIAEAQACEPHGPWRARRLFAEENRGAGRLDRYCVFEWGGEGVPTPDQFPGAGDPVPPEPDCLAAGGLAAVAVAPLLTRAELERRYLAHLGALAALPAATDPASGPVQVSVVDTARELGTPGQPGAGNSPHGRAMGLIVSRLACPTEDAGATCAAKIDNVPALRIVRTPAGPVRDSNGGYSGYLGDIAWGIGMAATHRSPGRHQILNLSLGWSRELADVTRMRPHIHAVYDAIRYARCLGALPIAAAGNTRGERPAPVGPLAPGAWQTLPAPTDEECRQDFGLGGTLGGPGPLVFAVSAVDPHDRPLTTTPPGARAPLAAPGLQVIVSDPAPPVGPPPVQPLTGSSVAAAAASALAAIAWTYRPELLPAEVMAAVGDAGVELPDGADFCFPSGACPRVRRLSTCALVRAACADGRCSPVPDCPADTARGGPEELPMPTSCAGARAPRGCAEDPPDVVTNPLHLPLAQPQPPDEPCGSTCDLGVMMSSFRAAGPAHTTAVSPLRLELPINPNLSMFRFTAHRLWVRDDGNGWLQIDLRDRLPRDQPGGATLRLDLDPAAEGIVGRIHSAQVDFSYAGQTAEGVPIRWMVGTPITVP